MRRVLSGMASYLLVLLLAVLVVLPSVPARAQGAGQTLTINMVPTGIEEAVQGSISVRLPSGYELWEANPEDISWGGETVSCMYYGYHGTKVFQTIIFPDGSQHSALGEQADGIDVGGGILFLRGPVDVQAEAEQYLKPYVEGTIYEEGAITVPGDGASYQAYYYLSTHTKEHTSISHSETGEEIEYPWTSVHHRLNIRVALSQSQPLYTVTMWAGTWGLPDGTHADGTQRTHTIDGKPQFDQHKKYLKDILSSITISGWEAPSAAPSVAPVTEPELTPPLTAVPAPAGRVETVVLPLVQLAEESPHPQLLEANYSASLSALRRNLENLKWAEEQHEYYQKQPARSWLEGKARGYNVAFWRQIISNLVKTMYQQLNTLGGFLDSARSIGAPVDYELDSQWQEARGTLDIARARYDIAMPAPEEVPVELEAVSVELEQILVELEEVPVQLDFLSRRHNSLVANINRLNEDSVQLYQSQQELLPALTEQVERVRAQSQNLDTECKRWDEKIKEDRTAFVKGLRDFVLNKLIPGGAVTREVLARTEPPRLSLVDQLRWSTVGIMETCLIMAHETEQLPPQQRIKGMASLLTIFISPVVPAVSVVSDALSIIELALSAQWAFLHQDVLSKLDLVHRFLETSLAYSEWNLKQLLENFAEIDEQEEDLRVELEEVDVELEELEVELEELPVELEEIEVEYVEVPPEVLELYTEISELYDEVHEIKVLP